MSQTSDLTIVIVSWNVKDHLRQCLKSIFQHLPSGRFDVWVIDNASEDGSASMVHDEFPKAHLIANASNRGFAAANNQAIAKAKGRVILLLNPDTALQDASALKVVDWLERHPNVGVAGCRLIHADGTTQASVRRFPTFASQALILSKLHLFMPNVQPLQAYLASDMKYNQAQPVDQVKGAAFFIHRRSLERIGALDEGFWIWFEEVDYCRRVWNADLEVWYLPFASVVHHQGKSFRKVSTFRNQLRMNKSMRRYFRKHNTALSTLGITMLQPLSLLLALIASIVPRSLKELHGIRS